jgi:hypothetical protein
MSILAIKSMAIALAAGLLLSAIGQAGETATPSGCAVGAEIPSFYVREATGSRPNQAVCLVCRYGERPAILICVRSYDDRVRDLLIELDRAVDAHRGQGLRGFAMFLDAEPRTLQPTLFTLARRKSLSLPLTFPIETSGPKSLDLPSSAQVVVLMYRQKKIERRFEYAAGRLNEEAIAALVTEVEGFAKSDSLATSPPQN